MINIPPPTSLFEKEFASRVDLFIFQGSKYRLTLVILTLHFQCWGWDTQHPMTVLQERAQLPKAKGVLLQFTCTQNAALRSDPCGFKICYLAWWFLKRCLLHSLVWEGIEANVQCVRTQEAPCVFMLLNCSVMSLVWILRSWCCPKGWQDPPFHPCLHTVFSNFVLALAFGTLWLVGSNSWSNWKLIIAQKKNVRLQLDQEAWWACGY